MAIIEVNHVTKKFQLGQLQTAKLGLQRMMARMRGYQLPQQPDFRALDDVDFKVEAGEVLGIIGNNGAGKSTLLKILSRITLPSEGTVAVRGRIAPMIEVNAGLVWEMTGRENIYLNAAILGMSKAEIRRKFDEIVAFSELEQFLDTPIKRYSSGMAVRLGFSIATSVDADILIVDEVLAVGDLAFQRKCFDRMEDMIKRQKKTVVLVSHNIRQIERLCTRAILLDHGRVVTDGNASEACNLFYGRSDEKIKRNAEELLSRARHHQTTGEVELVDVQLLDDHGVPTNKIRYQSDVTVAITYEAHEELERPIFGMGVHTTDFVYLATDISEETTHHVHMTPGRYSVHCRIKSFPFLPGVYALRLGMSAGSLTRPVFYAENVLFFQVIAPQAKRSQAMQESLIALDAQWQVTRIDAALECA